MHQATSSITKILMVLNEMLTQPKQWNLVKMRIMTFISMVLYQRHECRGLRTHSNYYANNPITKFNDWS